MSAFLSSLDVRVLDDCGTRPRMMTLEPFHYQSDIIGTILVPRFFTFDGPSIPQAAMSITGWPGLRAACLHDYLLSTDVSRETADKVFFEALMVCGVSQDIAELMYTAVRLFSMAQQEVQLRDDIGA